MQVNTEMHATLKIAYLNNTSADNRSLEWPATQPVVNNTYPSVPLGTGWKLQAFDTDI